TALADQQKLSSKFNHTIETLQADLAISTNKIAEIERAKFEADRALEEAEQAKRDAETAKQEIEQARLAETISSDALIAQLRVAAGAKKSRWEIALYGSIGGVLVILASSAIGFLINRRRASVSKRPVEKPETKPVEALVQYQNSRASTLSPGIAISEAAFKSDLEDVVATINAAHGE